MQDWEYQVADPTRIDEFLTAYESAGLSDDEKFTLMQTIIEPFNDFATLGGDLGSDPRWQRTLSLVDSNIPLHAYSVWYWSRLDAKEQDEMWYVTPFIRQVFARHKAYFASTLAH